MTPDADDIARLRWRELDIRRTNVIATAHYLHVDQRVAAHWCALAWEQRHSVKAERGEEVRL